MNNSNNIFGIPGIPIEIEGNRPFLMNNPEKVWIVRTGIVDVFSVRIDQQRPAGSREHMFRAKEGSALFGIRSSNNDSDIGLLAVGSSGACLIEIDKTDFIKLSENAGYTKTFETLTDRWIQSLSSSIGKGEMFPKNIQYMEAESEISFDDGINLGVHRRMVWIKHLTGAALYMGRSDWPAISGETYFPLVKGVWHRAGGESRLKIIQTHDLIKEGLFRTVLDTFHDFIFECISINNKKTETNDLLRLEQRKKTDRQALSDALSGLLAIFEKKKSADISLVSSDKPLLSASRMVGNALGITIRPPKSSGTESLDDIARNSRFRIREVILRDRWWQKDNGPLLAFQEKNNSPVALISISARSYKLTDPADGSVVKVTSEIAGTLAPKAYTFYRPFPEKKLSGNDLIRVGLQETILDPTMVLLMGACTGLLGLLIPIVTGFIFDTLIPEAARGRLLQIAAILAAVAISTAMFEITKSIAVLRVEGKMDGVIQAALWDRLLALPVTFFRKYSAGDLAIRSMGINAIRAILSGVAVSAVLGCIFSSFNLALLFYYNIKLAILAVIMSLVGILVSVVTGYLQVRIQKDVMEIEGKNSGIVLQFITGIAKLRISGTEDRAFSVWAGSFGKKKILAYKVGLIQNFQATFNSVLPVLTSMAIFAWMILKGSGEMTTGKFIAFTSAFGSFQNAMLQMIAAYTSCLIISPLYKRAKPIFESLPETDESKAIPEELSGDIEVNRVNFRYDPDGPLILKDVPLTINPGEFIAIVGGSGSGKSTLFRLLLGFEMPESGTIYYDGQDLSSLDIREVRRNIGVVLQNGTLMPGDIFKNIVGVSNLTIDDAWEAARMVGIEEEIKEMPMGMHTMIPAGGGTLSGGQRQRLLIARAIVKKPRILYFDEATSALDNKTQAIVSRSLEGLNSARIVIAHRLSTVMNADRIYVLEDGEIVETGTYKELMEREGFFAELAKRQIA